jgi:putative oxidoreductase
MSTMTTQSASPPSPINAIARFTHRAFGLVPLSLTMLAIRVTLAIPFWKSGTTKWDDWFTLSFGALASFGDFRLHILGVEYPYPAPELMAYASAICEVTFPVLLVLGLFTRYAALGLLGMTAIIQLTIPDGWQTFHLPWASLALAILTFGPGRIALDYALHLDQVSRP